MLVSDDDRGIIARLLRFKWSVQRWLAMPMERKITRLVCMWRGCVWHEAKWEVDQIRNWRTLTSTDVVAAHRTCSRCLRHTLTYHEVKNAEKEKR